MVTLMVVLMEAIHSLYDQSHGHTFSATLKLLIGSRTPTMVQLVTVCVQAVSLDASLIWWWR